MSKSIFEKTKKTAEDIEKINNEKINQVEEENEAEFKKFSNYYETIIKEKEALLEEFKLKS